LVVEVLLVMSGSETPEGGVIDAEFVIDPVALPTTVPVIRMVILLPAGNRGMDADALLPATVIAEGHTAPLVAEPQVAAMLFIRDGTASLNKAPSAALGPGLVIVMS
jgi:hypothetical protein